MATQLFEYLPEVLREDPGTRDFLQAFEKLLFGRADGITDKQGNAVRGLEQILDDLPRYFTPGENETNGAPDAFLPWLSQWVALSLRTDITQDPVKDNAIRRAFIARMAELYRYRGTKKSMKELLEIFTSRDVTIDDQVDGEPHYFKVMLNLEAIKTSDSREAFERAKELAHSVIRLEKPAHTRYLLIPAVTTMRVGQQRKPPPPPTNVSLPTKYFVRVGKNTRLGATPRTTQT